MSNATARWRYGTPLQESKHVIEYDRVYGVKRKEVKKYKDRERDKTVVHRLPPTSSYSETFRPNGSKVFI